jgi:hypothetical protein
MKLQTLASLIIAAVSLSGCGPSSSEKNAQKELAEAQRRLVTARSQLSDASAVSKTTRDRFAEEQAAHKETIRINAAENENLRRQLTETQNNLTAAQMKVLSLEETIRNSANPSTYGLTGEVFIVTKAGANLRMGRVEIAIYERAEIITLLNDIIKKRHILVGELLPRLKAAQNESERAREANLSAITAKVNVYNFKEYETHNANQKAAENISDLAYREYKQLKDNMSSLMSGRFVFDQLPKPKLVIKTNSDGKFKTKLPRNLSIVVAASATRNLGNTTESYYWMIPVPSPLEGEVELTLSNDNLCSVHGASLFDAED